MKTIARLVFIGLGVLAMFVATAVAETPYEVWGIDQSNSPGKTFGGTVYIYDGKDLERGYRAAEAVPELIDLSLEASALCFAQDRRQPGASAYDRHECEPDPCHHLLRRDRSCVDHGCTDTDANRLYPHVGGGGWRTAGPLRHPLAGRVLHRGGEPEWQTVRAYRYGLRNQFLRVEYRGDD